MRGGRTKPWRFDIDENQHGDNRQNGDNRQIQVGFQPDKTSRIFDRERYRLGGCDQACHIVCWNQAVRRLRVPGRRIKPLVDVFRRPPEINTVRFIQDKELTWIALKQTNNLLCEQAFPATKQNIGLPSAVQRRFSRRKHVPPVRTRRSLIRTIRAQPLLMYMPWGAWKRVFLAFPWKKNSPRWRGEPT